MLERSGCIHLYNRLLLGRSHNDQADDTSHQEGSLDDGWPNRVVSHAIVIRRGGLAADRGPISGCCGKNSGPWREKYEPEKKLRQAVVSGQRVAEPDTIRSWCGGHLDAQVRPSAIVDCLKVQVVRAFAEFQRARSLANRQA